MGRELWTALLALFCIGPITGEGRLIKETASQVQDVYEDSWLLEQLENELRLDREMMEDFGTSQSVMEYLLFDLNSDGVDNISFRCVDQAGSVHPVILLFFYCYKEVLKGRS